MTKTQVKKASNNHKKGMMYTSFITNKIHVFVTQ
nr:hypothetical protein [Mucilaginibacter sp. FT3.2]